MSDLSSLPEAIAPTEEDRAPDDAPPRPYNVPSRQWLAYRLETHATADARMHRGLSRLSGGRRDRRALGVLDLSAKHDPTIALIDAWAMVIDVLCFYQERILNEGFIRTAREDLSLRNLARLIDYSPRAGRAASALMAYTLEKMQPSTRIDAGAKIQSVAAPGQVPQIYETRQTITAFAEANAMRPPVYSRVPRRPPCQSQPITIEIKGAITAVRPGQWVASAAHPLLTRVRNSGGKTARSATIARQVLATEVRTAEGKTRLTLSAPSTADMPTPRPREPGVLVRWLQSGVAWAKAFIERVEGAARTAPRATSPASPAKQVIGGVPRQQMTFIKQTSPHAAMTVKAEMDKPAAAGAARLLCFRMSSGLFGQTALSTDPPADPGQNGKRRRLAESEITTLHQLSNPEAGTIDLYLDGSFEIVAGSWVLIVGRGDPVLARVNRSEPRSREEYGVVAKVTAVTVTPLFRRQLRSGEQAAAAPKARSRGRERHTPPEHKPHYLFDDLRGIVVHFDAIPLELSELPIHRPVGGSRIAIEGWIDTLTAGRKIVVSGRTVERTTSPSHWVTEVATISRVMLRRNRTALFLTAPLPELIRESVTVYGNVVEAVHGESRIECLGSGDGNLANQSFVLRQNPLTYVSAPTAAGVEPDIEVRVNGVKWHLISEGLRAAGPNDHVFELINDRSGMTRVCFGDGIQGARLPTGTQNVIANYRVGLGLIGNAAVGQISLPITRPQGVKSVTNLLEATGGDDPESIALVRRNAPRHTTLLDRLIGEEDYERYCAQYGGVGKALARWMTVPRGAGRWGRALCITIAPNTPTPELPESRLFTNLVGALRRAGDPRLPIKLVPHRIGQIRFNATLMIDADFSWADVRQNVRTTLLNAFSYESRQLGQRVWRAQLVTTILRCPGVTAVEPTLFAIYDDAGLRLQLSNSGTLPDYFDARPLEVTKSISGGGNSTPRTPADPRSKTEKQQEEATYEVSGAQVLYFWPNEPLSIVLTQSTVDGGMQ